MENNINQEEKKVKKKKEKKPLTLKQMIIRRIIFIIVFFIIVICISFYLDTYKPSGKIFDVIIRALDIFSLDKVREGRKEADVSCIVKTEDTSLLEIKDTDAVVRAGYEAVMENRDEILKII